VAQLRRALSGYETRAARYFVVTTGTPEHTREFCEVHRVPFTCLVDYPGEPGYAAFGLEKVGLRRLFGPSLLQGLWTTVSRFREVSMPKSGDVFQMSGAFVIDRAGIVRFVHRSQFPQDHPADEHIWACLDGVAA